MGADPEVIVVCGARRSGTTLLAAMLAADPLTPPLPGEAQLLWQWVEAYRWAKEHPTIRSVPFFDDVDQMRGVYQRMLETFIDHCRERFGHPRALVLKSPELSLCFAEARELFPQARFIVTVRDPRDQVASEWRVLQRRAGANDQRILRDRNVGALAHQYLAYYEPILRTVQGATNRLHFQSFEQMVTEPRAALGELEQFTGLDLSGFDPLRPWPRVADSYWAYGSSPSDTPHYGQSVEADRSGSFAESISIEEARIVTQICGDVDAKLRALLAKQSPSARLP